MYKNFNLTESEREQILSMHKNRGYRQPLNEEVSNEGVGQECYMTSELFCCVGETSQTVKELQIFLNKRECCGKLPPIATDGIFGEETKKRLMVAKTTCFKGNDLSPHKRIKTPTGERYVKLGQPVQYQ